MNHKIGILDMHIFGTGYHPGKDSNIIMKEMLFKNRKKPFSAKEKQDQEQVLRKYKNLEFFR